MRGVTPWRAAEARLLARRVERAHQGRPVRALRRRAAAARHHPHVHLRARARGARHRHLRARRARLLEPAAGGRPAQLPRRAGQPARRPGALLGARLAAGRPVARLARADRRRGARQGVGPVADAHRPRGRARPGARAGGAGRRVRRAVRGRARAGAADLAGDADRPRGHHLGLRPRGARPARRGPADGERAQADADGARVRGRGGPRPARLHRLRGRARPGRRSARARRRSRRRTSTPCG